MQERHTKSMQHYMILEFQVTNAPKILGPAGSFYFLEKNGADGQTDKLKCQPCFYNWANHKQYWMDRLTNKLKWKMILDTQDGRTDKLKLVRILHLMLVCQQSSPLPFINIDDMMKLFQYVILFQTRHLFLDTKRNTL